MIRYCYNTDRHLKASLEAIPEARASLVWIDMLMPTEEEMQHINKTFNVDLPTQDEMREIEISSRLYEENGAQYMTMTYLANALGDTPEITQLTFVIKDNLLITMRYREMRLINHFLERAENKGLMIMKSGRDMMIYALENFTDLCADVLEKNNSELETLSKRIFEQGADPLDYKHTLKTVGRIGDLNSKIRETLVSLNRTITFWHGTMEGQKNLKDNAAKLKTVSADVTGLLDQSSFISNKVTFLLDAVLGLVSLEQNAIIKIFSVAAVIFLPPTLVASIYGMNFDYIPELKWVMGYPIALLTMVISAILPFLYFKYKKWL